MKPLEIRSIRVRDGLLDLEVAAALDALHVPGEMAARLCALLPNLPHHLCVNDGPGESFGDEIVGTELPHLLEHLIIELQGQAYHDVAGHVRFRGHTSWLAELAGTRAAGYALMRTTVTFANDFVALQATRDACGLIEWAIDPGAGQRPDVEGLVGRLRRIMSS